MRDSSCQSIGCAVELVFEALNDVVEGFVSIGTLILKVIIPNVSIHFGENSTPLRRPCVGGVEDAAPMIECSAQGMGGVDDD